MQVRRLARPEARETPGGRAVLVTCVACVAVAVPLLVTAGCFTTAVEPPPVVELGFGCDGYQPAPDGSAVDVCFGTYGLYEIHLVVRLWGIRDEDVAAETFDVVIDVMPNWGEFRVSLTRFQPVPGEPGVLETDVVRVGLMDTSSPAEGEPLLVVARLMRDEEVVAEDTRTWVQNEGCRFDCSSVCGDGVCNPGGNEDARFCPSDCTCGDALCDSSESCSACPADCGPCCGDGDCNATLGEEPVTCPADCESTPCDSDSTCDWSDGEACSFCPDCACGGLPCQELYACAQSCAGADAACIAYCYEQACPAGQTEAGSLIDCVLLSCPLECGGLVGSAECSACLGSSCPDELAGCGTTC